MSAIGFGQAGREKWAGPGGWNDLDNILIGHILWQKKLGPTPLTKVEQYTYISLWSLLAAPLVFGGDMTKLDAFTLELLTNDEAIDVNQDILGKQGVPVAKQNQTEVWMKPLADGSKAVGMFNRGDKETEIAARRADLQIQEKRQVRDLWRHQDAGMFDNEYRANIPPHRAVMVRIANGPK